MVKLLPAVFFAAYGLFILVFGHQDFHFRWSKFRRCLCRGGECEYSYALLGAILVFTLIIVFYFDFNMAPVLG